MLSLLLLFLSRLSTSGGGLGLSFFAGEFSFSFSTLKGLKALLGKLPLPVPVDVSSELKEVTTGALFELPVDECIMSETADAVESTTLSSSRYAGTASYSKVLFSDALASTYDLLFFFTRNALGMIALLLSIQPHYQ